MFSHLTSVETSPNVWKMFTISPSSLTFCTLQKTTCPNWTIYSWKDFFLIGCPLLLKPNYRCVESFNISVYVSKCVENVYTLIHYIHIGLLQKMTCHHSTFYSWQSSNSLVCPLMLITNYRCVQSRNISVDVAKCVENVHKFTQFTHFLSVTKKGLSWLNNLFVSRFQLISMSTYANNKLQMCSVTQHQCRWRQMCGKCSQIHQVHSLFVRTCPDWTIFSWQTFNSLGCPLMLKTNYRCMLKTNYRCVQPHNISVDIAKCVENVHTFIHYTHFWTTTKNDLSSLNNLFTERFQLTRMSFYAKNKLQMCSVTQNQCRLNVKTCQKSVNELMNISHIWQCLWLNNYSWQSFNTSSESSYAKNKLQMWVTTHST